MSTPDAAAARSDSLVRRLQLTKFVRAVGQGALLVVFSLYMKDLGWSAAATGVLFSVGGLLTAALGWIVGMSCDRTGRKKFLLAYEAIMIAVGAVLAFTESEPLLAASSLLVGVGRSQSGIPGPMGAAEQAWLAEGVPVQKRGSVFSHNAALGFFGMAAGSVIVGSVPWMQAWLPGHSAYRAFFLLLAVGAAVNLLALWNASETFRGRSSEELPESAESPDAASVPAESIRREENRIMLKMALINALNGVAIGLTSPLLVYWFNIKYGVGPGALGPVFALTFLATGLASVWTGLLTDKIGIVRAVVTVRLASVILLVLVPLMPTFTLAAGMHILRTALGRGSVGARRALAVNLVRAERRGLASSVNDISMQLPQAVGPSLAGAFIASGHLALPFFLGALMQFLYGTFYGAAFQRYDAAKENAAKSHGPSAA